MKFFDKTYREIINVASSDSPTPGGGSVAAMVGCLGNAMISMVGNLTVGREKYKEYEDDAMSIIEESKDIMIRLEGLVDEDMNVFGQFMDTLKMPKETDEEKSKRKEAMAKSYIAATEVPLTIAQTCLEFMELGLKIAPYGNKSAISDAGVGVYIGEASLLGALLSVDINLSGIKDEDYVKSATKRKDDIVKRAAEVREEAINIVKNRL